MVKYSVELWKFDAREAEDAFIVNGIENARKKACRLLNKYGNGYIIHILPHQSPIETISYNKWQNRYQIVNSFAKN